MKRSLAAAALTTLLVALPHGSEPDAQQSAPNISGTWAKVMETTSLSKIPVMGEVESTSRLYSLVRVEQSGDAVTLRNEACWVRIDGPTDKFRTIVPQAMVDVIGPKKRKATFDGRRLQARRTVDVLGARLDQPWSDPLPTEVDAETVLDQDGDGHPGVTVRIVGVVDGEIRVVQRTWNSFDGTLAPSGDRIRGRVDWKAQQEVLDATSRFLTSSPRSRPHPDPDKSTFDMVRVPGSTTCKNVIQNHARYWPEEQ